LVQFATSEELCRRDKPPVGIEGKTVLLVDIGIHTGGTIRCAVRALRTLKPACIAVATPAAATDQQACLEDIADIVHCLRWKTVFANTATCYRHFEVPHMETIYTFLEEAGSA
ncbi:MAG TPA: phosphoribosyltransferase family protein, partial [Abditibacteriaceae bacterium]